jgi:HEAT repeat protein
MTPKQLKNNIFNSNHRDSQHQAAYQMRYVKNDPEIINILFCACYEATDSKLQRIAVESLNILNPKGMLKAFISSTYHRSANKRKRAYMNLGILGSSKATKEIIKGFSDSDISVREAAVIAAGKLAAAPQIIVHLNKLIRGFEPEQVKKAAIRSVKSIQNRLDKQMDRFIPPVKKRTKGNYVPTAF